ncbi:MAG: pseudouridine synthase [Rickettsiales bacterium]
MHQQIRLNKRLSELGICSRREADRYIVEGRIKVNGLKVKGMGVKVTLKDEIVFDNKVINSEQVDKIWLFYKPVGFITSHKSQREKKTIFELVNLPVEHVKTVGRLDINSEGLLILTTSSRFKRLYEDPENQIKRKYKVRVYGSLDKNKLFALTQGKIVGGVKYRKCEIKIISDIRNNTWLEVVLFEGKNREIRNLLDSVGLKVNRLIRTEFGEYKLGHLTPGEIVEIKA